MRKLTRYLPAMFCALGVGLLAAVNTGCDGKFTGPPTDGFMGLDGLDPLPGVTWNMFQFEDPTITGFYNDVWYIDPGLDADDAPQGLSPWYADSIQGVQNAGFSGFVTGGPTPIALETNTMNAMMMSMMSQWFKRMPNGARKQEVDQFDQMVWSDNSLDINFLTNILMFLAPPPRWMTPGAPNMPGQPLDGWIYAPLNPPNVIPSPKQVFPGLGARRFSRIGQIAVNSIASQFGDSLGNSIPDDQDNSYYEAIGSPPQPDPGGGWTIITLPTGVFVDNYVTQYITAPILKPTTPGVTQLEAIVEYARHLGAVHTNLIVQAIGLPIGKDGTLTDSAQVVWQNRYGYAFDSDDLGALKEFHLPGKFRDPDPDNN